MTSLRQVLVGFALAAWLGGCVAAECREGSHDEGGKCVADDAGSGGSAGSAGMAGEGGSAGSSGLGGSGGDDEDAGVDAEVDAVVADEDAGSDAGTDAGPEVDANMPIVCGTGYVLTAGACTDIDECMTNPCGANATCSNNVGSFMCACNAGYEGDGISCTDTNECAGGNGGCDALTMCTNTVGSYTCGGCPSGYSGTGMTGCTDNNECMLGTDDCDNMPAATCSNAPGSFTCACPNGYAGNGRGSSGCQDVDECLSSNGGCDTMPMVSCTNTNGGRTCGACPSGYSGNGVGANGCQDVNECDSNNGGCDALVACNNTAGSRTCGACPTGYTGNGNSPTGCVPSLSALSFMPGPASVAFAPNTRTYNLSIGRLVNDVRVVARTAIVGGTVEVNGTAVDAFDTSFVRMTSNGPISVIVRDTHGRSSTYTTNVTLGGTPAQVAYLKGPESRQYGGFGRRMAISGDTLVVSGPAGDSLRSLVHVFVRSGTTWNYQATLRPEPTVTTSGFGAYGLAISGDTIVVGAPFDVPIGQQVTSGIVYVFVRSGTTWSRQAVLVAENADAGDYFGFSVAIDGDRIAVGAPMEDSRYWYEPDGPPDNGAADAGAAYVFERTGTTWQQTEYLKPRNGVGAGDYYGWSVDVQRDRLIVGAPREDGSGTGVNPARNELLANSGAAYVYNFGNEGSFEVVLKPDSNGVADGAFGTSVAFGSDRHVVIGAPATVNVPGRAYVFAVPLNNWVQRAHLQPSNSANGDRFGERVEMWHEGTVVVTAPSEDGAATTINGSGGTATDAGAAYVFHQQTPGGNFFSQVYYVKPRNMEASDSFGIGLALEGDRLFVGSPAEDSNTTVHEYPGPTSDNDALGDNGAGYVFQ